ncbi:hypothetical protein FHW36_10233 [Chitinophaga polysaccharea]|uniref:Glycoside hydrolase 123-like N-terminal domain-containing protein n=2 Tax=Chitinophaga polysaccharea TaxID=1293035 RepID=A0A561PW37_9BACT|nr:hypothetical protein FHW36_10233 [Chitinophaga polysaccharea]
MKPGNTDSSRYGVAIFWVLLPALLVTGQLLMAQLPTYGTGQWNENELGNHRAVIEVSKPTNAVKVHVPWRRKDNPAGKGLIVVDAFSGKPVKNVYTVTVNAEYGDIIFEPVTGPGEYYLYYMPYKLGGSWYFPSTAYLKPDNSYNTAWQQQLNIKNLPDAKVLRFEAINSFNSFYPMEIVATQQEVRDLLEKNKEKDFLLFPEDRKFPVRMDSAICQRWIEKGEGGTFYGLASRNEFYVYQVGVFAAFHALKKLHLQFSDLENPTGGKISAAAIRCFNLEGKDWLGKSFKKEVSVGKGQVQALWIGVDIPREAQPGVYHGWVKVSAEGDKERSVPVQLNIKDALLEDRGYNELPTFARLNWLDSDIGLDDSVYRPYTPVVLKQRTVNILGRTLRFDKYGFPDKITSSFTGSNNDVNGQPRDILNGPVKMVVVQNGKELAWKGPTPAVHQPSDGAVSWETQLEGDGVVLKVWAKMECDGYINYQLAIKALKDCAIDNMELRIPYARKAAIYMMGLGRKGGVRPERWDWKWEEKNANNMLWMGDVNAGLQCKLKNETPDWTLYNFDKTGPYKDWSNDGKGGCHILEEADKVMLKAFTGQQQLRAGQIIHLNFGLLITPVKPLDQEHWSERYFQADPPLANWRKVASEKGATVMNIHQGNMLNPYINYPFLTTDTLTKYVTANRRIGISTKLYYTVRELTNYTPEIWALRSLGDEIFSPGKGSQLADQFADDGVGGNLFSTGGPWLVEHLGKNYDAAWHTPLENSEYDMSIRTQGLSRWHNYYLEGLNWLVKNVGIRGIYLDGVGYDRDIMKRVRKVMDRAADSCLIDFHSGNNFHPSYGLNSPANQYMELFPCLNSLWLGEGYNYNESPDYWLVEVSGIPFGLYSEMLNNCGNAYRGMLFGMTSRLGWTGCDPSALWRLWDKFDIKNARMVGCWDPALPVKCSDSSVKVTVYRQPKKLLIVYASWAKSSANIRLDVDWKSLGWNPNQVNVSFPEVEGLQRGQAVGDLADIKVEEGKGGFIIIEEK